MQTQYTDAVLQYIGPSENATVLRMLTSATVSRYRVPNLCTLFYIYIYCIAWTIINDHGRTLSVRKIDEGSTNLDVFWWPFSCVLP